jgi:hypothetical protein
MGEEISRYTLSVENAIGKRAKTAATVINVRKSINLVCFF